MDEIIIKNSDLIEYIKSLPETGPFGEKILANGRETAMVNKNITGKEPSKEAELHENFADIFIVKEGREEFFTGGEIKDKKLVSPGEWRGENLLGARKHIIEAGDTIIIPKGVAHQHGAGAVKMIVIKIG